MLFRSKLGATPALGRFFSSSDRVRHARNAQRDHWIKVFEDGLDQAYHERALTIGNTHARIGLEPKWYIGGYALILEHLIESMALRLWNVLVLRRFLLRSLKTMTKLLHM